MACGGFKQALEDLGDYAISTDPENICACGTVTLEWVAERGGNIMASPEVDPPVSGEVGSSGEVDVEVCQNTEFKLTKDVGEASIEKEAFVNVVSEEGQSFSIIAQPDCSGGTFRGWNVAQAPSAGDQIKISGVLNDNDRQVEVTHAGITGTLPSGGLETRWNGESFSGSWQINASLESTASEYESCNCRNGSTDPDTNPRTCKEPPPLTLNVQVRCE